VSSRATALATVGVLTDRNKIKRHFFISLPIIQQKSRSIDERLFCWDKKLFYNITKPMPT